MARPIILYGIALAASAFLLVTLVLMRLFAPMPKPHEGRVG